MILSQTEPTTKTHIKYDRSARTWQAVNGTVTPTGNGPDGKRAALLLALAHDHPQLFARVADIARMHNNAPALVDRLIKAAALVAKNHVSGDQVISQTQADKVYIVRYDGFPKSYKCDCPDNRLETDLGETCKHSLAIHLAYLTS